MEAMVEPRPHNGVRAVSGRNLIRVFGLLAIYTILMPGRLAWAETGLLPHVGAMPLPMASLESITPEAAWAAYEAGQFQQATPPYRTSLGTAGGWWFALTLPAASGLADRQRVLEYSDPRVARFEVFWRVAGTREFRSMEVSSTSMKMLPARLPAALLTLDSARPLQVLVRVAFHPEGTLETPGYPDLRVLTLPEHAARSDQEQLLISTIAGMVLLMSSAALATGVVLKRWVYVLYAGHALTWATTMMIITGIIGGLLLTREQIPTALNLSVGLRFIVSSLLLAALLNTCKTARTLHGWLLMIVVIGIVQLSLVATGLEVIALNLMLAGALAAIGANFAAAWCVRRRPRVLQLAVLAWTFSIIGGPLAYPLRDHGIMPHFPEVVWAYIFCGAADLLLMIVLLALNVRDLDIAKQTAERQAILDPLTRLLNRRGLIAGLSDSLKSHQPYALLVFDLDRFKRINDTYGHAVGDEVLQALADLLRQHTRTEDLLARFGGEEFCIILPNHTCAQALEVAERLRSALADQPIATTAGPLPVSSSVGVSLAQGPGKAAFDRAFTHADAALYQAKEEGRNRVVLGDGEDTWTTRSGPDVA